MDVGVLGLASAAPQSERFSDLGLRAMVLIHVSYFPGEHPKFEAVEYLDVWLLVFPDTIVSPCTDSLLSVATET